ncbi:hypothetical protein [Streptomyces nigrescens]|uniref:Uncharacterized protein n=1 Tax=Streptomyces nigrescens TaxID=1920 RepID=A0ABY7I8G1_STRNI|nr:hypothetical protein [Streptomyces libani]WAT94491.1 hypothetical protein STRLI_000115 [Streptomyces libani subsp. libani]
MRPLHAARTTTIASTVLTRGATWEQRHGRTAPLLGMADPTVMDAVIGDIYSDIGLPSGR